MNRRIRRSIKHALPILIAPWLIATPALVAPAQTPETSPPPDFSNVDDVLLGRRLILPVQDLVATSATLLSYKILQTEQGEISRQTTYVPGNGVLDNASGRVFDLENDVIVTMLRTGSQSAALHIRDPLGDRTLQVNLPHSICLASQDCNASHVAVADMTGDGYDEIVIGYGGGGLQVAAAKDVASFTDGLVFGAVLQGLPGPFPKVLAIGDLNGDGKGDIASLDAFGEHGLNIYTLIAPRNADDPGLNIERASSTPVPIGVTEATGLALPVGQFDDDNTDRELVIAYKHEQGTLSFILVQVAANLEPTLGETTFIDSQVSGFRLAAGRLDWFGDTDQLALVTRSFSETGEVLAQLWVASVLNETFGFGSAFALKSTVCSGPSSIRFGGLALGDFDFNIEDPESTPPDLEVAVLLNCDLGSGPEVQLFQIADASVGFAISLESATVLDEAVSNPFTDLIASDTQGRSLLLGPPTKAVVNQHSQPRIVMGAPPMHIDYIIQDPTDPTHPATFGKVNMTAFPSTDNTANVVGMNSAFKLAATSETQTQTQHATSYNFSLTSKLNAMFGVTIPDVTSISAGWKTTAKFTHDHMVANKFGTYSGFGFDIDTITGFGDVVWYDSNRFNLWIYPVLGHFACPADDQHCDAPLPLSLTFSGPDQIANHAHTPGPVVEWYQPYHEAGNILSYPQDLAQLGEALSSDLDPFFQLGFTTGTNASTETLDWTQKQSGSQSSGSVTTHSHSKTTAISGSAVIIGTFGPSWTENRSKSLTTLYTSIQTMAASDGFQVSVPRFKLSTTYSYPFDGFILGDSAVADVLQTELLDDLNGSCKVPAEQPKDPPPPCDQTIHGTLRLAFTAQPDAAAGTWWQNHTAPYLSAPDVALNHPFRWFLANEGSAPLSDIYCFNVLDRDDVQAGGGYEMKGLFVLPEGATSGPQTTLASEGDKLNLEARVYNYSRLDMAKASPPVTAVKVQFYGQEWLPAPQQQFTGDAFLIKEVTLDPIPGNNTKNTGLNSTLATATFDTGSCPLEGGCGGKYLKFWLVVWMEDAEGNLVADYREHGLKKAPSGPLTQIGHVDVQPISNNVGYYDQEIYICPQGAQCDGTAGEVAIAETTVSSDSAAAFETLEVSARLESGEEPVGPLMIFFYEGDPENGGQAFEVEHVPFIAANDSYLTKVGYQPRTSGVHDLFVVAHTAGRAVTGTTRLEVTEPADPAASTCANPLTLASRQSGSIARVGEPGNGATMRLSAIVPLDAPVDPGAATVTIDRLAHELGGAGELITDADGASILPLTLEAHPVARTGGAVFVSEPGSGPQVRLKLRPVRGDRLSLDLRIRKASIPGAPELCSGDPVTTSLMARLASIDDGTNPPLEVPVEGIWECNPDRAGGISRLRVRDTSFGGSLDVRGSGRSDQATSREDPPRG